jgi:hypothetical protein
MGCRVCMEACTIDVWEELASFYLRAGPNNHVDDPGIVKINRSITLITQEIQDRVQSRLELSVSPPKIPWIQILTFPLTLTSGSSPPSPSVSSSGAISDRRLPLPLLLLALSSVSRSFTPLLASNSRTSSVQSVLLSYHVTYQERSPEN